MQIWHGTDEYPIWIMAAGVTGGIRGINRDDFRPDLIVLDDILDDENCLTKEQRHKLTNLVYGAILGSLAPATESSDAKLAMLQTPLDQEDASTKALSDPMWKSIRFSCWTPETEDLPVHQQVSAWEERYPSKTLQDQKKAHTAQNRLSIWVRENECKLVAPETCSFRAEWLNYFEREPEIGVRVIAIDPVPPPSQHALDKNLHNNDYECIMVMQRTGNNYYILDYVTNRGHDPSWTIAQFFSLCFKYNPRTVIVESVAYQRTLAWLLRRAMEQHGRFWAIKEYTDQRPKFNRIVDALNGIASAGHLHCQRTQTDFIQQFQMYKHVPHDDVIECAALCADELNQPGFDFELGADGMGVEDDIPSLNYLMGAP